MDSVRCVTEMSRAHPFEVVGYEVFKIEDI